MQETTKKFIEFLDKNLKEEMEQAMSANNLPPTEMEKIKLGLCLKNEINKNEMYLEFDDGDEEGYSNRRGRSSVTGRYVSRDYDPNMNHMEPGYSRRTRRSYSDPYARGYSGHSIKDRMVDRLEGMYDEASTEHERQMIDEWINRIEMNK